MIEFRNEDADYSRLTRLFAYRDGKLVHRQLVERDREAELRAQLERRYS